MDTQLIALLMFLLLSYLLFRRPASAASRRCPTELNFQIGHPVNLKSERLKKKSILSPRRNGLNRSFPRGVALGFALVLPSAVVAMAQSPTDAQVQLAGAGNISRGRKEDKKEGGGTTDMANDGKDN
jgi:hypothetical protein